MLFVDSSPPPVVLGRERAAVKGVVLKMKSNFKVRQDGEGKQKSRTGIYFQYKRGSTYGGGGETTEKSKI